MQLIRPITNLPGWLEHIGMAKYLWCFEFMAYDEFLGITVDALDRMGYCVDDRNHLHTSITGLKSRNKQLLDIRREIAGGKPDLPQLLKQMKQMAKTPMELVTASSKIETNIALQFLDIFEYLYAYLANNMPKNATFVVIAEAILENAEHSGIWPINHKNLRRLMTKFSKLRQNKESLVENQEDVNDSPYHKYRTDVQEKYKTPVLTQAVCKELIIEKYDIELDMSRPLTTECSKTVDGALQKDRRRGSDKHKQEPQKLEKDLCSSDSTQTSVQEIMIDAYDIELDMSIAQSTEPVKVSVQPLKAESESNLGEQKLTVAGNGCTPPLDGLTDVQAYWYWDEREQYLKSKKQEIYQRIQEQYAAKKIPNSAHAYVDAFLENPTTELLQVIEMIMTQSEANDGTERNEPKLL